MFTDSAKISFPRATHLGVALYFRLANTLLRLLRSLAHLIVTGDRVATTYPQAIRTALVLVDRSDTTKEALMTLDRLVEERIAELEVVVFDLLHVIIMKNRKECFKCAKYSQYSGMKFFLIIRMS